MILGEIHIAAGFVSVVASDTILPDDAMNLAIPGQWILVPSGLGDGGRAETHDHKEQSDQKIDAISHEVKSSKPPLLLPKDSRLNPIRDSISTYRLHKGVRSA